MAQKTVLSQMIKLASRHRFETLFGKRTAHCTSATSSRPSSSTSRPSAASLS